MKNYTKKELLGKYNTVYKAFWVMLIILLLVMLILGFSLMYTENLYQEAVKQGAEGIVLSLEMVVACQELGNVTIEQIQEKVISNYIYRSGEK